MICASWIRCIAIRLSCGLCLVALACIAVAERVMNLRWVAYSPTHSDSNRGIAPSLEGLKADLSALRKAQLGGLVTYSCAGAAQKISGSTTVFAYCMGNVGYPRRYTLDKEASYGSKTRCPETVRHG